MRAANGERRDEDHFHRNNVHAGLDFGPLIYRLMAGPGPLREAEAEAIIDSLFRGLANGAPAPKARRFLKPQMNTDRDR